MMLLLALVVTWLGSVQQVAATGELHELCDRYQSYTSWPYIVNNNAWNNQDDSGGICTYVCGTCPKDAVSLYSLWNWTSSPPAVHAYPNVEFRSDKLPLRLSDLLSLRVSSSWAFGPATSSEEARNPNSPEDLEYIQSNNIQANVVLDVFADEDAERSRTPSEQKYEFMVWVGQFGTAAQPVGNRTPRDPPVVARLDATDFTLWNGTNSNGQYVYSWIANETLTDFDMDFAPLLGFLAQVEGVSEDLYLGTVQFGHETFLAASQMNFSISSYAAEIQSNWAEANGTTEPTASLPVATKVSAAVSTFGHEVGSYGSSWLCVMHLMVEGAIVVLL